MAATQGGHGGGLRTDAAGEAARSQDVEGLLYSTRTLGLCLWVMGSTRDGRVARRDGRLGFQKDHWSPMWGTPRRT